MARDWKPEACPPKSARPQWLAGALAFLFLLIPATGNTQTVEQQLAAATQDFQRGRFADAEAKLRAALQEEPRQAYAWKVLGVVYAAQGLHDLASEPFAKACQLDAREVDACYFLARNHYLRNRFEEALQLFTQLRKTSSKDWRYHNGAGLALSGLGKYREAERAFREAMRCENGHASLDEKPAINLGSLYLREGRAAEALDVLAKVTSEHPAAARAWFEQGKAALQLDRLEAAEAALKSAVAARPQYRQAHLLLAKLYARIGDAGKASQHRRLAGLR
jgi:Flp pilus assembly protein TadD